MCQCFLPSEPLSKKFFSSTSCKNHYHSIIFFVVFRIVTVRSSHKEVRVPFVTRTNGSNGLLDLKDFAKRGFGRGRSMGRHRTYVTRGARQGRRNGT